MRKYDRIAVIEIPFESSIMWDEKSAIKEHGSFLKAMQWLFENDGMGIFDEGVEKLVAIKPHPHN